MNEYVLESLKSDNSENEVFKYQQHDTLNNIDDALEKMPKSDILFEVDFNQIMPFNKLKANLRTDDNSEEVFWNHTISLLFMNSLYEQYFIETKHDLDEERRVLTRENVDDYYGREPYLVNRNDVIETINELMLDDPRIHIVLKYLTNENVLDEVLHYLDKDIPYSVKIYSDGDVPEEKLRDKRSVKVFNRDEAGLDIKEILGRSYEKKI